VFSYVCATHALERLRPLANAFNVLYCTGFTRPRWRRQLHNERVITVNGIVPVVMIAKKPMHSHKLSRQTKTASDYCTICLCVVNVLFFNLKCGSLRSSVGLRQQLLRPRNRRRLPHGLSNSNWDGSCCHSMNFRPCRCVAWFPSHRILLHTWQKLKANNNFCY